MARLVGRLALVTGGGGGIGRAVCLRFAREGASVFVADICPESATETLSLLPTTFSEQQHSAHAADVSNIQGVTSLLNKVQSKFFRPPCIAVNSAGITSDAFLIKLEEAEFDKVLHVNLKGTFLISQAVAKALVSSGASNGSIINLSSIVGKTGNIGQANYAASKAGVLGLTMTTAKELARHGIRCNAVLPGFIATSMTSKMPPKVVDKIISMIPMGRMGYPEEVAGVCAFLASDDSKYITGASIEVTGGLHP
uniref:(3R)-3-hydroxyacyl-CoA dehydrogenase n=1 Tax=Myxine glutinosa TaxID=7769 RepID=UPI00358E8D9C